MKNLLNHLPRLENRGSESRPPGCRLGTTSCVLVILFSSILVLVSRKYLWGFFFYIIFYFCNAFSLAVFHLSFYRGNMWAFSKVNEVYTVLTVTIKRVSAEMSAGLNLMKGLIPRERGQGRQSWGSPFLLGHPRGWAFCPLCRGGTQLFFDGARVSCGQHHLSGSFAQTAGHTEVWPGKLLNTGGLDRLEKRKI